MAFLQRVKRGRFLHDLFEASLCGGRAVTSNQQRNFADVGNIFEQVNQPDLADKSGYANQQEVPLRHGFSNRKALDSRRFPENRDRLAGGYRRTGRRLHGTFQPLGLFRPAKLVQQLFTRNASVGRATRYPRERSARSHDGIQQPARCLAGAKFQPVGEKRFNSEMMGQRTKDVFKELPDKNDTFAAANRFDQLFRGFAAQLRLQHVVKILFPKKIESIAADSAK